MRGLFTVLFLIFSLSWTCFIGATYISGGTASPLSAVVTLFGVFIPSLVALAATTLAEGRAGTLRLLRRTIQFPVGVRWYIFALGYMASIKLSSALIYHIGTGSWPAFGQTPWYLMAFAIIFSTPVQAGEEIGWRGYALPRLARGIGLAPASILLGIVWGAWHLPFFFIPGSDNYGRSFPVYLLAVTALSVAMAWLYWRTNGSLFITMLMHAAVNNTATIVSAPVSADTNPFSLRSPVVSWLTAALLSIGAVYFLILMRRARCQVSL